MNYTSPAQAEQIIRGQEGKIFHVQFIKADGTLRDMLCRTGVHKHVTGKLPAGQRRAEDQANACVTVFDLQKMDYRRIPLSRLREIRASGEVFRFSPEK